MIDEGKFARFLTEKYGFGPSFNAFVLNFIHYIMSVETNEDRLVEVIRNGLSTVEITGDEIREHLFSDREPKEICVGTNLFVVPTGNAAHFYRDECYEATVSKIGRMYFYVEIHKTHLTKRFEKKTMMYAPERCDDCNSGYKLYWSQDEVKRKKEIERKRREIYRTIHFERIPDYAVEVISEVLGIK